MPMREALAGYGAILELNPEALLRTACRAHRARRLG